MDSRVSPKKIEANRIGQAGWVEVDDAAPYGVLSDLPDRAGAQKAVGLEPGDDHGGVDRIPGSGRERFGGDASARRHPLHQGVHRRRQEARPVLRGAGTGEPRERRHALRGDGRIGGHPVVGLAIPGRKGQHLDLGSDESERVLECLLALPVARHMDKDGGALDVSRKPAGEVGDRQRVESVRHARQRQVLAPLEGVDGSDEGGFHDLVESSVAETRARGPGTEGTGCRGGSQVWIGDEWE